MGPPSRVHPEADGSDGEADFARAFSHTSGSYRGRCVLPLPPDRISVLRHSAYPVYGPEMEILVTFSCASACPLFFISFLLSFLSSLAFFSRPCESAVVMLAPRKKKKEIYPENVECGGWVALKNLAALECWGGWGGNESGRSDNICKACAVSAVLIVPFVCTVWSRPQHKFWGGA